MIIIRSIGMFTRSPRATLFCVAKLTGNHVEIIINAVISGKIIFSTFWFFVIITGIMLFTNIVACLWSNMKVHELMSNDHSIPAIKYAKEALSTLFIGAIVSIAVDTLSWILPKTNIIKTYGILEKTIYKATCLSMAIALNVITFSNRKLQVQVGHPVVDSAPS